MQLKLTLLFAACSLLLVDSVQAYQQELPTLDQALEISKATGKPILAMAGRDT